METATMNKIAFIKESAKIEMHKRLNIRNWLFEKIVYGYRDNSLCDNEFVKDYIMLCTTNDDRGIWQERKNYAINRFSRKFSRGKISETLLRIVINSKRHSNN